ncbi:MAG: lipid-A-disaccharide synthase [Nitrospinae bacterium RIFCSPLOWO2_12_FULL_45_22]|nr:MAG: lipid-A-disaccharide synthase [Nitrospinae bacterium RIFCSPLOWO2_12_FULL_45_22]
MGSKKIFIMAGEASADLHGANLVKSLLELSPDLEFYGVGGPKMRGAGVKTFYDIKELNTVGLVEVFGKALSLYRIYRHILKRLREGGVSLAIFIDFPGLNIRLGRKTKDMGIPPVYYIGPQVWAGRTPWRVRKIARSFARILVIFPFEVPYYQKKNGQVEFIGHPLLDVVRPSMSKEEAREVFGLDPQNYTIGLFPGSRPSEIELLLPPILQTCQIILNTLPETQFVLALADTLTSDQVEGPLSSANLPIKIIEGRPYDVMQVSDFLLLSSGTATLEAALMEKPMIILYKLHFFSWLLSKIFLKAPYLGLVNDIAGQEIAAEFQQYRISPQKMARVAIETLQNPGIYSAKVETLKALRPQLGIPGAARRAAQSILELL